MASCSARRGERRVKFILDAGLSIESRTRRRGLRNRIATAVDSGLPSVLRFVVFPGVQRGMVEVVEKKTQLLSEGLAGWLWQLRVIFVGPMSKAKLHFLFLEFLLPLGTRRSNAAIAAAAEV